jgi:colanic acid biosynthesis glycosyl transferase WcaI
MPNVQSCYKAVATHDTSVHARGSAMSTCATRGGLRILFICSVCVPEPEPSGVMALLLAQRLNAAGHNVTLIAPFPNRPGGTVYKGYRRKAWMRNIIEGVPVIRVPHWLIGSARHPLNRLFENISFGAAAAMAVLFTRRADVVIVETWPLFAVQFCRMAAALRGIPWIYYIKDVYPEAAEAAGIIVRCGRIAEWLRRWDSGLCRASSQVVVISEGMRALIEQNREFDSSRITVIEDWIDETQYPQFPHDNTWRREKAIPPHTFVALFAGNIGLVSGADILIEVATLLRSRQDILILCVGQGMLKAKMIADAQALGLTNIRFEPFQERSRVPEVQCASSATVLTMQKDVTTSSVPSKLISYLAAGRPVVCAAPEGTDAAEIVRAGRAGIVVEPGNARAIADAIVRLADKPAEAAFMGKNARAQFMARFTVSQRIDQFQELLSGVLS